MIRPFYATLLATALSCASAAAQNVAPAITAAVADTARPAGDKARSTANRPKWFTRRRQARHGGRRTRSGGGYYTAHPRQGGGADGKACVVATTAQAARPGGLDGLPALAAAYPNVKVVTVDYPIMALPEKADLFWTTENYHDFHNGPTANIPALDNGGLQQSEARRNISMSRTIARRLARDLKPRPSCTGWTKPLAKSRADRSRFQDRCRGRPAAQYGGRPGHPQFRRGHFVTDRFMLRLKRP